MKKKSRMEANLTKMKQRLKKTNNLLGLSRLLDRRNLALKRAKSISKALKS